MMAQTGVIPSPVGWHETAELHRYFVCDVFTSEPLEGNQLGVFTDGRPFSETQMQRLAREMNFAETVFLLPANEGGDARMRIFTPAAELPFAGHPVLGTAFVVGAALGADAVRLETGAGLVPITLERDGARVTFGRMSQPIPAWEPFGRERELLDAIGAGPSLLPVELYRNGPPHVYVQLASEARPDRVLPLIAEHLPDLRLILHSKYAVDSITGLQSGALDVAFVRGPIETEGLETVELLHEEIVMVLPSHHALARRKRVPVESLDDLPCITMERSLSPALHDAAAKLYRDAKIRMHAVSSADNMLGHLQLVQEGQGFALLPDSVSALLPPGVTFRPLACDPVPTVNILVAWKSGNDSRLVREFVDLARRVAINGKTPRV